MSKIKFRYENIWIWANRSRHKKGNKRQSEIEMIFSLFFNSWRKKKNFFFHFLPSEWIQKILNSCTVSSDRRRNSSLTSIEAIECTSSNPGLKIMGLEAEMRLVVPWKKKNTKENFQRIFCKPKLTIFGKMKIWLPIELVSNK